MFSSVARSTACRYELLADDWEFDSGTLLKLTNRQANSGKLLEIPKAYQVFDVSMYNLTSITIGLYNHDICMVL